MRPPAVAGMFYPSGSDELNTTLDNFFGNADARYKAIAGVAPHAGYQYSGQTAANTYANLAKAETIVVLGPDHTGSSLGQTCVYFEGNWQTPLGEVRVDEGMAQELREVAELNNSAHSGEHSIEVQLPFIQKRFPGAKVLPIMMGDQNQSVAVELGQALAKLDCVVVASSDFSHYVPVQKAEEDDLKAIGALKNLDVDDFYKRAIELQLSACGIGPIAAAMEFAKEKGAKNGVLLDYTTSSEVTGEDECVGYASVVFI